MTYIPDEYHKEPQIDAAIADATMVLSPDIKRIRYQIKEDWDGDWAVYFYVLTTDDTANFRNSSRKLSTQ